MEIRSVPGTFQTQDKKPMMKLWRSLIICEYDYCCQIWTPHRVGHIHLNFSNSFLFQENICNDSQIILVSNDWPEFFLIAKKKENDTLLLILLENPGIIRFLHSCCDGSGVGVGEWGWGWGWRVGDGGGGWGGWGDAKSLENQLNYLKGYRTLTKSDLSTFKSKLVHFLQVPDQPSIPDKTAWRECCMTNLIDWSQNTQLKEQLEEPLLSLDARVPKLAVHTCLSP